MQGVVQGIRQGAVLQGADMVEVSTVGMMHRAMAMEGSTQRAMMHMVDRLRMAHMETIADMGMARALRACPWSP